VPAPPRGECPIRVGCYPADRGGCGHSRLIFPAQALAAQGADVVILDGLNAVWRDGMDGTPELMEILPPPVDVVVIQRPLTKNLAQAVPMLQRSGIAVVCEIDDSFHTVPSGNPAWAEIHPKRSPERNARWLSEAIRHCDLLTVSTPALAARYGAGAEHTVVLRNLIPERYLSVSPEPLAFLQAAAKDGSTPTFSERDPPPLVVGWPGTPSTHPGDLEVCRGAVAAAVRDTGAVFGAIGSQATALVLGIPSSHAVWRPWTTIEDYPTAVASLDVGIAPLMDSAFNRCKSALKALEYAALSVPFVHSPLPEYLWLGAGVPAHNPRVWERELKRLLTDEAWRIELAEPGRERASGLTYERGCGDWWDAWEGALTRRRHLTKARSR
jgi:hypothetical protein